MPTLFWIWLAAAAVFLIIELGTPSLVFACFFAGCLCAAIISLLTSSYLAQIAVFAGISIILIPLTRPLARKITKPSPQKTNVDALVNRPGVVTKAIDPDLDVGQVRVDGQVWQAVASQKIGEGAKIIVNEIRGARLYVSETKSEKKD
jgi:membrane protein implicated in regulation of membrane protease activity